MRAPECLGYFTTGDGIISKSDGEDTTRPADTVIPVIRPVRKYLETIPLQLNPVDSCWLLLAFWNDRPARVYY